MTSTADNPQNFPTVTLNDPTAILADLPDADTIASEAATMRANAQQSRAADVESFERCDTDGFLSQWGHRSMASEYEAKASLIESHGRAEFPAIFTPGGELIDATRVQSQFGGWRWRTADRRYLNQSAAKSAERRAATNLASGFVLGTISDAAYVELAGSTYTNIRPVRFRADERDYSKVIVIDNGQTTQAPEASEAGRLYDPVLDAVTDVTDPEYPVRASIPGRLHDALSAMDALEGVTLRDITWDHKKQGAGWSSVATGTRAQLAELRGYLESLAGLIQDGTYTAAELGGLSARRLTEVATRLANPTPAPTAETAPEVAEATAETAPEVAEATAETAPEVAETAPRGHHPHHADDTLVRAALHALEGFPGAELTPHGLAAGTTGYSLSPHGTRITVLWAIDGAAGAADRADDGPWWVALGHIAAALRADGWVVDAGSTRPVLTARLYPCVVYPAKPAPRPERVALRSKQIAALSSFNVNAPADLRTLGLDYRGQTLASLVRSGLLETGVRESNWLRLTGDAVCVTDRGIRALEDHTAEEAWRQLADVGIEPGDVVTLPGGRTLKATRAFLSHTDLVHVQGHGIAVVMDDAGTMCEFTKLVKTPAPLDRDHPLSIAAARSLGEFLPARVSVYGRTSGATGYTLTPIPGQGGALLIEYRLDGRSAGRDGDHAAHWVRLEPIADALEADGWEVRRTPTIPQLIATRPRGRVDAARAHFKQLAAIAPLTRPVTPTLRDGSPRPLGSKCWHPAGSATTRCGLDPEAVRSMGSETKATCPDCVAHLAADFHPDGTPRS